MSGAAKKHYTTAYDKPKQTDTLSTEQSNDSVSTMFCFTLRGIATGCMDYPLFSDVIIIIIIINIIIIIICLELHCRMKLLQDNCTKIYKAA